MDYPQNFDELIVGFKGEALKFDELLAIRQIYLSFPPSNFSVIR